MKTTTTTVSGGAQRRTNTRRFAVAATAIALVATGAVSAQSYADVEDGGPLPASGEQLVAHAAAPLIQTSGSTFDDTILTKYIAANGFQPLQGSGTFADLISPENGDAACLAANSSATGNVLELTSSVELPDGARIKRVTFYGHDQDPVEDIAVSLVREEFSTPFALQGTTPVSTRELTVINAFSTSGQQPEATVFAGADDLGELTGTLPASPPTGTLNRFHTIQVDMVNASAANHVLCGVKVEYQVAAVADPGTVFHPVGPVRAFDSRQAALPESGRLGPNETKVIDITDGYDSSGVAIPAQANVVPAGATAVAYNITIAGADGPNFVAVTAGDAASFTASAINYSAGSNVANGSTVTLAADQTIKLWGGDNTGSSHVVIDIVGFYSAPVPSNMAN